ncbi:pentapeptide repeat-containing protein [Ruminococcus sp. AM31-15AC]|jgi:hypothetical protein|uniref:pentapeptide repeat-containing protein n=1 Tax=Ruminococcus sp. AM31-15AC TaxID=2293202 RepID=UPI000E47A232|nr:pentapeptide repeat-containing protein [Ruminococcus sp. AM31-15AC]
MGRAKRKRKAKEKAKRKAKIKAGKLVRFVLSNSPVKYNGWSNRYNYQSNLHHLIYKDATFTNDKFQNCIITDCNFKQTSFTDVDFAHCNLKGSTFKNSRLKNVTFFNCKMKSVDFSGATFDNVAFICMSIDATKNLPSSGYVIINKYPQITHQRLLENAMALSQYSQYYKYHILNVDKNKVNNWYLYLLAEQYQSYDDVARGLYALRNRYNKRGFITVGAYKKHLDTYLKI